ncbi:MAG: glycosyltransferase family 4 protein [Candidatus Brocadiales bacterium]|nr:glycosyltransferase family 4 protein [Candidatus Brocadiales bacterium]
MDKTKLVIVNQIQFGYLIDNYYYCKYLRDEYEIIYICWDHKLPEIEMSGIRILYVNREGNFLIRTRRFLKHVFKELTDESAIVFNPYFKGVSLVLKLCRPKNSIVLDIRTGSVNSKQIKRKIDDWRLKFETMFFSNVTVISESLARKLNIADKAHILPLGADTISSTDKRFESLNLLYVGTLYNRKMEITLEGFKQFYAEFGDRIQITYTIIGGGPDKEENILRDIVSEYGLSDIIKVKGPVSHDLLAPFFDASNIGISYVPLTDYFDVQPVTKTFEYILSGMPVIATRTLENKRVVNHDMGVLIGDTAEDFYSGLKVIYENRALFESANIRNSCVDYTWRNIVLNNLQPYLKMLSKS